MLITAIYLFWPKGHQKSFAWKFFVNAPLGVCVWGVGGVGGGWVTSHSCCFSPYIWHWIPQDGCFRDHWGKVVVRIFFSTDWPFRDSLKNNWKENLLKTDWNLRNKNAGCEGRNSLKKFSKNVRFLREPNTHANISLEKTTIAN